GRWKVVYNAVNFDEFQLTEQLPGDSPLIFLGRIERIKGCHTAINVAKATGNKLIIAGNISRLREEREYFENEIKPLVDGCQIIYVGEVNDEQKNDWLGKSKAMLMPIEWNEPFGIVMIEAMACGTPVIGYKKGSIPEVVEENKTGFVVMNENEMIAAVKKINVINRTGCRETAKAKFNSDVVAHEYLNIFSN
ncbi:MAG: glycosyltransferase, partial [Sphingobacteriales bacterium]|nr:glycosyltransferase [Sphingobacteriales bacterium]